MKIRVSLIALALFSVVSLKGQTTDNCAVNVLLTAYSERAYIAEPVTDQQLEIILSCGIKAPSGRNNQPWKFTVVRDEATMKEAIDNIVPGNALIIVSGTESQEGRTPDLDCGLAVQNMFVAAHALGLGARIYAGPIGNINSKKELFQIPAGYKPVVLLRVGNVDKTVDAVSAATPRKKAEEVVNYWK